MPLWTPAGVVDSPRTWGTAQTFSPNTVVFGGGSFSDEVLPIFNVINRSADGTMGFLRVVDDYTGGGFVGQLGVSDAGLTGNATWKLPGAGVVTLVGTTETVGVTGKTLGGVGGIKCGTSTTTAMKFQNVGSISQFAMLDLGNLTAQRNYVGPDYAGVLLLDSTVVLMDDDIVSHEDELVSLVT